MVEMQISFSASADAALLLTDKHLNVAEGS